MTYGDRPTCAEIGTVAALEREITRLRTAEQHALSVVRAQQETIDRLRAELAECKQDAERYRWLRKVAETAKGGEQYEYVCDAESPEHLDRLIDAARKGEGAE